MAHQPVLLKEVVNFLNPKPGDFIVDGTIDGGGHAAEIFKRILPGGKILGIDLDGRMIGKTAERILSEVKIKRSEIENSIILEQGSYADLPEILRKKKLPKSDGLLLDLGFSSEQLESGRGFSFQKDEPLIMTYNENFEPVKNILRKLTEKELADIVFHFGGERYSRKIARAIHEIKKIKPIMTTKDLRTVVFQAVPKNYERGRIDPATRTFQALRIYANKELGNLETALKNLPLAVRPGGRAAIISFHSLEDKLVKNYFRNYEKSGSGKILTKKPIVPGDDEVAANPRSRSAKLRAMILA